MTDEKSETEWLWSRPTPVPRWRRIAQELLNNPKLELIEEALQAAYHAGLTDGIKDEQRYVLGRQRYGLKPYQEDMGR